MPMEAAEQGAAQGAAQGHKTPLSPASASMDIPRKRTGQVGSFNPGLQSTSQFSSPGVLYGSSLPAGMYPVFVFASHKSPPLTQSNRAQFFRFTGVRCRSRHLL